MQEDMTPIQHLIQKAVSSSDNAGLPKICEEKSDLDVSPALVLCWNSRFLGPRMTSGNPYSDR